MSEILAFSLGTLCLVLFSWRTFRHPGSHGFYRFFAAEAILALIIVNAAVWFHDLLRPRQLVSWLLLFASLVLAVHGFVLLHRHGKPKADQEDNADFVFEKTSTLVCSGAYQYIRHPLYTSLLLLTWGALLKHVTLVALSFAACATAFLVATALAEEKENLARFGTAYATYSKTTKRFIPFLV
ncbi:isoprenylcysteine carboxylmethyltransferase family protein [candidate division KSB1 bacterium]|nr:isoprenylcysteine carboxylmethyltransferase family protein [candidate division KSB1 bacterium]